jgi:hypothetical protein
MRTLQQLCLLSLPVAMVACSGQVADPGKGPGGGMTGPGGGTTSSLCTASPPPTQRLYLMDMQSYTNTVTDLLGPAAVTDLLRTQSQRVDLFTNGVPTLTNAVERETVAEAASKTLTGAALDSFTGCAGAAAQTDACARKTLSAFMVKAYRRPVDAAEVDSVMATAYATGKATSFERGIQLSVEAILQAGSTMYLKEIGTPKGNGLMALDPYEVASQLSYALLDSMPDDALYQAAATGHLKTAADVEAQVTRLLAVPRAQKALNELLLRQYHLGDVLKVSAIDASYQAILTPSMLNSMYQETNLLLQDVLWDHPRSYAELFQTNKTFVNAELAQKIYNVPFTGAAGQFVPVDLPASRPSAGFLTQGSLLAGKAKANTGSVVKRGKSIRINFLCLGSPPPPPTSDPAIKARLDEQAASPLPEATLAAARAADPVCKTCHATFDPFGLALNQFDRAGRFVATEPASASLEGVDNTQWAGVTVDGPVDLGKKLAAHPNFASCVASSVLRYETHDANEVDYCSVQDVGQKFKAAGFRFDAAVKAASTSDQFLVRTGGAQ